MGGGALVPLLEREDVENIHILGHDKVILSLANGDRIPGPPLAGSEEELVMMIRHLAATAGHTSRRFDTAAPILDLRLASGHRLFAVTAVAERTSIVIRRHRMLQSSLERLEQSGTVTPPMIEVLRAAVRPPNPANMLVVGGTGAGKTTLLRSLLSEVPQSELVVTIEDTLELHLRSSGLHERTLALETRTANTEGLGEISMYDLCRAALRMSPDRVIVGEVRGGEVMQLLQSMGIGNDGSLGTIHAGSTRAAINKMLIYAQRSPDSPTPDSVLREISEVLHLLVYIKKLPDGRRAVTSIREVVGYEEGRVVTSEVFAPGPDGVGVYVRALRSPKVSRWLAWYRPGSTPKCWASRTVKGPARAPAPARATHPTAGCRHASSHSRSLLSQQPAPAPALASSHSRPRARSSPQPQPYPQPRRPASAGHLNLRGRAARASAPAPYPVPAAPGQSRSVASPRARPSPASGQQRGPAAPPQRTAAQPQPNTPPRTAPAKRAG